MPPSRASCGLASTIVSPLYRISPSSGWKTPEMTLISVDFPAPLSPASATTSPAARVRLTFSRACTPPKRLLMFRASRRNGTSFIDPPSAKAFLALIDEHRDDDDDTDR